MEEKILKDRIERVTDTLFLSYKSDHKFGRRRDGIETTRSVKGKRGLRWDTPMFRDTSG